MATATDLMTVELAPSEAMTADEYLAAERGSNVRHEFYRGEVTEMSGGSIRHGQVIRNLFLALGGILQHAKVASELLPSEVQVRTPEGFITYPDVSISFVSELGRVTGEFITTPVVICEVLSPSTEAYDRGEKFRRYGAIPSLRAYVLVSQGEPLVEIFERDSADASWTLSRVESLDGMVSLTCLEVSVEMAAIYQRITFDADHK